MSINESLAIIKEEVSEQTYIDIVQLIESSLFPADNRGDLLDDISKVLTGKSLGDHLRHGTQKLVKAIIDKRKQSQQSKKN